MYHIESIYFLCFSFVCVSSQNLENIEKSISRFKSDEKNFWKTIEHYKNDQTRIDDMNKVLEFYEFYMNSTQFEEIGIFQMISKEWLNDQDALKLFRHIATVNTTFTHALKLIKHKRYVDILKFVNELTHEISAYFSRFLLDRIGSTFWNLIQNTSRICDNDTKYILAESQVVREVYKELLAHFLKSYILIQFTNSIKETLTEYGGFAIDERRSFRRTIANLKNKVYNYEQNSNFSREMWTCDPNGLKLMGKDSPLEIPISYQGFISNEMNLNKNRNCRQSCPDYTNTRQFVCDENSYCPGKHTIQKELLCHGFVQNCITIQDDVSACVAPTNSTRRYDFIELDGSKVIGVESNCSNKIHFASHWNWFYRCDNCFCYCNEEEDYTSNVGIRFSLQDVTSYIDENLIVTGVGIKKVDRSVQLTILQQKLLPSGLLNTTMDQKNSNWIGDDRTSFENKDYVSITWHNRSIALTSTTINDNAHVVTGARFRKLNGHIGIEIRVTRFDFVSGLLMDLENSFWIGNSNTLNELNLHKPDVPSKSLEKSEMFAENNEFIKFQPSDIRKDGAQTTVPYLDTSTVTSFVPLAGIGLYYKSTPGYGGFIAPKLITYDFGRIRKKEIRRW